MNKDTADSVKKKQEELDATKEQLDTMKDSKKKLETIQSGLDTKLNELMPRVIQLEELTKVKEEQIAANESELGAAQTTADDQYGLMKKRIQFIYENGNSHYLEYVLEAGSIVDALNRVEYVHTMIVYDQEKLDEFMSTLKVISDKKAALDEEEKNLLGIKGELDTQQAEITAAIDKTSREIAQYDEDISSAETLKNQYQNTITELRATLREEALSMNKLGSNSAFNSSNEIQDPENYVSIGDFKLTFYCPCIACNGNSDWLTSRGGTCTAGRTIAVDPSVIPYGSTVMIGGHVFTAEDCGGDIKGNRIDVFVPSHEECDRLGVVMSEVFLKQKKP